jgi:hypothetical protein
MEVPAYAYCFTVLFYHLYAAIGHRCVAHLYGCAPIYITSLRGGFATKQSHDYMFLCVMRKTYLREIASFLAMTGWPNEEQNVQVCDATMPDSNYQAN